jgi:hypothetical protein
MDEKNYNNKFGFSPFVICIWAIVGIPFFVLGQHSLIITWFGIAVIATIIKILGSIKKPN